MLWNISWVCFYILQAIGYMENHELVHFKYRLLGILQFYCILIFFFTWVPVYTFQKVLCSTIKTVNRNSTGHGHDSKLIVMKPKPNKMTSTYKKSVWADQACPANNDPWFPMFCKWIHEFNWLNSRVSICEFTGFCEQIWYVDTYLPWNHNIFMWWHVPVKPY